MPLSTLSGLRAYLKMIYSPSWCFALQVSHRRCLTPGKRLYFRNNINKYDLCVKFDLPIYFFHVEQCERIGLLPYIFLVFAVLVALKCADFNPNANDVFKWFHLLREMSTQTNLGLCENLIEVINNNLLCHQTFGIISNKFFIIEEELRPSRACNDGLFKAMTQHLIWTLVQS